MTTDAAATAASSKWAGLTSGEAARMDRQPQWIQNVVGRLLRDLDSAERRAENVRQETDPDTAVVLLNDSGGLRDRNVGLDPRANIVFVVREGDRESELSVQRRGDGLVEISSSYGTPIVRPVSGNVITVGYEARW